MKERPLLFSAPMVRALLDGSKTQTRRAIKPQPQSGRISWGCVGGKGFGFFDDITPVKCPYGQPGDRLWVRENHAPREDCLGAWDRSRLEGFNRTLPGDICYQADGGEPYVNRWRPSIHMPRWASRLDLEITSVRVERLQDISEADAIAEGIRYDKNWEGFGTEEGKHFHCTDPRISYMHLWEQINGAGSWDLNPWVWVVEFKRIKP